jgi:pectate lyase|tara:strand:- start:21850 stop:22077 length:228 start_codon:yes stop_codon:yes gene_type:complete
MERGPIMRVLTEMKGTSKELDLVLQGQAKAMEIRNVVIAEELHSANGIRITTRQNEIWLDASHVSAMWQAREDGS